MKPILFSTSMVQAILDGRKTQTRRVIKAPVLRNVREPDEVLFDGKICKFNWHGDDVIGGFEIKPKYQPGDILWVRETWAEVSSGIIEYKATYKEPYTGSAEIDHIGNKIKWRPSIHMPREAARIFLKVTNVRVERLQEITAHDAIREGMESEIPFDTVDEFKELWNNLNAKRGYGWDTNPWVWVVEFEQRGSTVEGKRG